MEPMERRGGLGRRRSRCGNPAATVVHLEIQDFRAGQCRWRWEGRKKRREEKRIEETWVLESRSWKVPWGLWALFWARWESFKEPQKASGRGRQTLSLLLPCICPSVSAQPWPRGPSSLSGLVSWGTVLASWKQSFQNVHALNHPKDYFSVIQPPPWNPLGLWNLKGSCLLFCWFL